MCFFCGPKSCQMNGPTVGLQDLILRITWVPLWRSHQSAPELQTQQIDGGCSPVQQQFAPDCCSTGWWFEIFFGLKPPSTFWVGDFFLLFFNVSGRTSQTIPCEANTWLASRCSISSAFLFTRSPCKSRLRMIQGIYFMGFWCCIHIQLIMVWKVWRPLKGTKGNMRKRRAAGGTCLHV